MCNLLQTVALAVAAVVAPLKMRPQRRELLSVVFARNSEVVVEMVPVCAPAISIKSE